MADAPLRIEFVCTANIARSPYAERTAASMAAGAPVVFGSSGLSAPTGVPMDPGMAAELRARGVRAEGHSSKPLDDARVAAADLLLVMEVSQRQRVLELWPQATRTTFTLAQFVDAVEALPEGPARGAELIPLVFARRPAPDRRQDVADPHRRGAAAAAAAAERLDLLAWRLVVGLGLVHRPRRALWGESHGAEM